jgi:outer membrane phospholipase A
MHGDAKFQISAKTKLWQDIFDTPLDLWAAYTQQTYWQVYDGKNSRPFRETDFQPEAWLTLPLRVGPEGLQWRMLNLGLSHQSNGQNDPLSRSWNRVYATFGLAAGDLSVLIKPWWRLPESGSSDNNADVGDYAGRLEVQASGQQGVDALDVGRRVFRQAAFGQQRLVEQDVGQVMEVHQPSSFFTSACSAFTSSTGLTSGAAWPACLSMRASCRLMPGP